MPQAKRRLTLQRVAAVFAWVVLSLTAGAQLVWGKDAPIKGEPDYTKGEKLEGDRNWWSLGPIGATGNIWAAKGLLSHGQATRDTRMIQIQEVWQGTPAAGVLEKDDVILGVISPTPNGSSKPDARFDSDVRKALSAAITKAEEKANGGKLVLNIWRPSTGLGAGKEKTFPATIALPVKGTYSATAPWECEKTKVLVDEAAQFIVKRGLGRGGIAANLEALGLLATGEEKYVPVVRDYARKMAGMSSGLDIMGNGEGAGIGTWDGAYRNLFLTEYYLATGDKEVLPGIAALSTYLALGQSGVGTWSHGMADVQLNGLYGPPCAYGAMNQCSLTCALSLILAQKCGIKKKEIDDSVQRSLKFYRWYVDKGLIPYGDHPPAQWYDNNGKNSQAAVFFDIAGEKEAATYYTRMTLASYHQREQGHTGNYFSWLWGALGAGRGGPEAAQSFAGNTRWFRELERRPDGGAVYQFELHPQEHGKYPNWSTTGPQLLQNCLPRKALHITGKGGSCVDRIQGDDLKAVVAAAEFDPKDLSVKDLLATLGNWSLFVRRKAAEELGNRDENVVKDLIAMLDSPDRYRRYGACVGLMFAGRQSEDAVDAILKKVVSDQDLTMRYFAVDALRYYGGSDMKNGLGDAVKKSTETLLKLAATYEPERDPQRKLQAILANLFHGYFPKGKGTETLDRSLLIPAMKSWLINPNGGARSDASRLFYPCLTEEDLKQVWGDIYYATKYQAPSGVMFSHDVRILGLKLMAEHKIEEGIEVGVQYAVRQTGWGDFARKGGGMPLLLTYGKALEPYLPEIVKVFEVPRWKDKEAIEWKNILDAAMAKLQPALQSIKSYIEKTPDPRAEATKP